MIVRLSLLLAVLQGCADPCADGRICVIAGTGELGFNGDGPALESHLASPTSVGVDPDGVPFVVDYSNMRVRTIVDGQLQTIVGNGFHAYSEIGVPPLESPLENPVDAAWGPDGLLYVLPQHEGRLIRIDEHGLTELCVGSGVLADTGDGGDALDAEMGYGGGLALGSDGSFFVSDQSFSRVRRVRPDGVIDTVLGTGSGGSGPVGLGPDTAIRNPERLALDRDEGRLYVADTSNHRVLAVDLATLAVEVVAGTGQAGFAGDGGPAAEAQLDRPVGLLALPDGGLLVADLGNDVLRRVAPDGTIAVVAGDPEQDRSRRSAPALDARIHGPAGLAWDGPDVLIAERTGQHVLRWVGAADAL